MADYPPLYTILALALVPLLALAVFFAVPIVGELVLYETFLMAVLGLYGISGFLRLSQVARGSKKTVFDLFPGVVEDRFLVGFDALFSVVFLFATSNMPQNDFIAFVTLILGSLGFLGLAAKH
mgnify:CR=1 FL=1